MGTRFLLLLVIVLASSWLINCRAESCESICKRAKIEESDCQSIEFNDEEYYKLAHDAENDPVELKEALRKIIRSNVQYYDYASNQTLDILRVSDESLTNGDYLVMFYTGELVLKKLKKCKKKSAKGGGERRVPWDKEHVWAKTYGFPNEKYSFSNETHKFKEDSKPYMDLHNLRPCNSSLNKSKNDKYFKDGGDSMCILPFRAKDSCRLFTNQTPKTWESPFHYKGDAARIVFYMELMYGSDNKFNLDLTNNEEAIENKKSLFGHKHTLYNWSMIEAVDETERHRNHVLYCIQKNRNPFIDHPEWLEKIYGNKTLANPPDNPPPPPPPQKNGASPTVIVSIVVVLSIVTLFLAGYGYNAYKGAKGLERIPLYTSISNLFSKSKPVRLSDEEENDMNIE